LSQDCPNKGQTNNTLTTSTPKWTGKSMASHIRALIALMSDEEKKILEEEGWYGFLKRRTASMSAPPVYIFSVHKSNNNNSFHVDAIITTLEKNELIETQPLVDSGTEEIFMDQNYARKQGLSLTKLEYPITARNVDGTKNKQETIWYYMDLDLHVNGKTHTEWFLITGLGNQKVIWDYPGCESITQKSIGKKEHYSGELQQQKKYWTKKNT
jgi:hypothetical protein